MRRRFFFGVRARNENWGKKNRLGTETFGPQVYYRPQSRRDQQNKTAFFKNSPSILVSPEYHRQTGRQ